MDNDSKDSKDGEAVAIRETPQALIERGYDLKAWRVFRESIWPSAKSNDAIFMALDYCKARGLDPLKKPVHIVPVWNSALGKEVETVWPSITEHRITAARTGQYAGKDAPEYGPDDIGAWTTPKNKKYPARQIEIHYPEWCRVTVYKLVNGMRCAYSAQLYWREYYGRIGRSDVPNARWEQAPRQMLAKCAEAEALREAFPEEIGEIPTAEEMDGQIVGEEPPPPRPTRDDVGEPDEAKSDTKEPADEPEAETAADDEAKWDWVRLDHEQRLFDDAQPAVDAFIQYLTGECDEDSATDFWLNNADFRLAIGKEKTIGIGLTQKMHKAYNGAFGEPPPNDGELI